MSKLILFLADGTTMDVSLRRERTTIGRRPDNDVCLPNLAVSGEHAAVVTILADSFLEDLGSTNGTLVNGKPIAKHFLRDGDHIDIGRHVLVYCVDDNAVLAADLVQAAVRATAGVTGNQPEAKPRSEVLEALTAAGGDVKAKDVNGSTPLLWAVQTGCAPSAVAALLKAGADPNAKSKGGATPLMFAEMFGRTEIADVLRKAGAGK